MSRATHTPARSVRVSDEVWAAAKEKAAAREETVSDVLLRALRAYLDEPDLPAPDREDQPA